MSRVLAIAVAVATAGCASQQSTDTAKLASFFLPPRPTSDPCSLSAVNPHAMDAYPSNPYVSADETFLNLMALWGGDSFPRNALSEAGMAFYGVPRTEGGISVYRLRDEPTAKLAAAALSKAYPHLRGVFQKRAIVAVAWESVGADPQCPRLIVRHLEDMLK